MTTKEKGRDVVILLVVGATLQGMWCLMKHHHSGFHRNRNYHTRKKLKTSCNKNWGSRLLRYDRVLKQLKKNKLMKKLLSVSRHKVLGKLVSIKDNQNRLDQVKKK